MSFLLFVYHYFNVLFGFTNISYNPYNNNYNIKYWPIMIYGGIFNVFSLIGQIFCIHFYVDKISQSKLNISPLYIIHILLYITYHLACLTITLEAWLKRKRLHGILQKYQLLLKQFSWLNPTKYKNILYYKLLLIKFLLFILQIVALTFDTRMSYKNTNDWLHPDLIVNHVINCLFYAFMELCIIVMDLNIYADLVFIYICSHNLTKYLKQISKAIKEINDKSQKDSHKIIEFLENLKLNITKIAKFEQELNDYYQEFMQVFQLQFILLILILFGNMLTQLFYIFEDIVSVVFFNDSFDNISIIKSLYRGIFHVFMYLCCVLLFFNICELLRVSFKEIRFIIYQIILYTSLESKNIFSKDYVIQNVSMFNIN